MAHRDTSNDMQLDLLGSNFDLRSNFGQILALTFQYKNTLFKASQREKYDGAIADSLNLLVLKVFVKNDFRPKRLF